MSPRMSNTPLLQDVNKLNNFRQVANSIARGFASEAFDEANGPEVQKACGEVASAYKALANSLSNLEVKQGGWTLDQTQQ